jgi:GntR family transcriptional regulator/MocR family aminotransferase
VHGVHPVGPHAVDPVDDVADGRLVREDTQASVHRAHLGPEVLVDDGRLIARLHKQVSGKQALRCFLEKHHRVPVVDVRRFEKAQLVSAKVERLAVFEALQLSLIPPAPQIDFDAEPASGKHRFRGRFEKAIHPSAFVGLEVEKDHVLQGRWVEDLRDGVANPFVIAVPSRVDQGGQLIRDQKLVEGDSRIRAPVGDPVDVTVDVVDPRLLLHLGEGPVCFLDWHAVTSNRMLERQTNLAWDTLLPLDLSSARGALHSRLTTALRDAIRSGRIPIGSALPPSRQLAADLGCSRWVVTEAYEQLVAEGYLEARVGSATRVRAREHDSVLPRPVRLQSPQAPRFDFGPGSPDLSAFPRAAWLRAMRETVTAMPATDFDYQATGGHPRLREVLAEYLRRVRGADVQVENVTITTGILDGITQLGRALAAVRRHRIAVEEPCWQRLYTCMRRAGMEIVPITVDRDGLRVDEVPGAGVHAVMVAPAHQYPTGSVLSPARRAALLDWAHSAEGLILEDDYDAEFRYDRHPLGTMHGIDSACVALFGSLSKTLAPAVGLGWMVTPDRWTNAVRATEGRLTGPSVFEQLALARFMEAGDYDRHLRAMRRRYRSRRDRLVAAVAKQLPECPVSGAAAGLHVLVLLPRGMNSTVAAEAASGRGIRLLDLHACRVDGESIPGDDGLVLGYGNLDDDLIEPAVTELAAAIRVVA